MVDTRNDRYAYSGYIYNQYNPYNYYTYNQSIYQQNIYNQNVYNHNQSIYNQNHYNQHIYNHLTQGSSYNQFAQCIPKDFNARNHCRTFGSEQRKHLGQGSTSTEYFGGLGSDKTKQITPQSQYQQKLHGSYEMNQSTSLHHSDERTASGEYKSDQRNSLTLPCRYQVKRKHPGTSLGETSPIQSIINLQKQIDDKQGEKEENILTLTNQCSMYLAISPCKVCTLFHSSPCKCGQFLYCGLKCQVKKHCCSSNIISSYSGIG